MGRYGFNLRFINFKAFNKDSSQKFVQPLFQDGLRRLWYAEGYGEKIELV
jgi:hypothetical protein